MARVSPTGTKMLVRLSVPKSWLTTPTPAPIESETGVAGGSGSLKAAWPPNEISLGSPVFRPQRDTAAPIWNDGRPIVTPPPADVYLRELSFTPRPIPPWIVTPVPTGLKSTGIPATWADAGAANIPNVSAANRLRETAFI